uniref:Extracellular solute-binding protein n=1 Tax=Jahnella sp. MSr9139 TaxID=1434086 RepID=A0A4Y5SZE3_9BACT|nr:hypothetical protein [Jahnella sp. MSr9139]
MWRSSKETEQAEPKEAHESLGREVLKLVAPLALLGCGVFYLAYGLNRIPAPFPPPRLVDVKMMTTTSRDICGEPPKDGFPVMISMLYSDDKQSWVLHAAERFAQTCPNIQVKLISMGSIKAADAILNGQVDPTLWAPADELLLHYLDHRWKERSSEVLFNIDAQVSLAISPLVAVMWEDRYRVLNEIEDRGGLDEGFWMDTACALVPRDPGPEEIALEDMTPGRWSDWYGPLVEQPRRRPGPAPGRPVQAAKPAYQKAFPTLDEIQRWGRVKFSHASPRRAAGGLEVLYLMAYDYLVPPEERASLGGEGDSVAGARSVEGGGMIVGGEHLREAFEEGFADRKEALARWLRRCEAGLEAPPESAAQLTDNMFHVGAGRYDGVMTHENLVFEVLDRIDDHEKVMRNVRIIYPQPTLVNQHPVVFLRPEDPARAPQIKAARHWIGYLRSNAMQLKAIEFGFRPAIPELSLETYDVPTNPFLRLRRYGVSTEIVLEEPPRVDGHLIEELLKIWEDATGRN